jgi:small neutral amino acid transporter SnatA (MarC family)
MKPDQIATAMTNALVQGGSQWLVATIVAFLPVLWTLTLILHLGRPYVLRTLRRCGLRLGADIWWMSYLLMRDAALLLTFALSWVFFSPNIVVNAALPITGPLAALCLLLALAVKLSRRVDDDVSAYRLSTAFLVLGATLYYGALVFAVEATSQPYLAGFGQFFTSNSNPTVALWVMWISLAGVAIVAGWLFARLLASANRTMARRLAAKQPPSTQEPAPAVP